MALEEWLEPPRVAILSGPAPQIGEWQRALAARYLPTTIVVAASPETKELPVFLQRPADEAPAVYVCRGTSCLPPIRDATELAGTLAATSSSAELR